MPPAIPQRIAIVFYGSLLITILMGIAAGSLRDRSAAATQAALAPTETASRAPTPTLPPRRSDTPGPSPTPSATFTLTPSPTATFTFTPSPTFTASATPTATHTPTPWPTPGPGAQNRKACVPILMYHHIGYPPADADPLRLGLTTSPERFEEQLAFFREQGVSTISLYDLLYYLTLGRPLPEKPVILTIDDGYDDVYQYGFPLLQKYGYTATLFIPTGIIDAGAPGYMTWPQIVEMAQAGNDVEPHTKDHVDLRRRKRDYLIYQILGSKQTIEAHVGHEIRFFAYPAGAYDENTIAMLQEMNFWGAVSTDPGVNHSLENIYTLPRLRVSEQIDVESMKVYLRFCGFS